MSQFESLGICTEYVKGKAEINNALPRKYPVCKYCQPYYKYDHFYDRHSCRITGEWLFNPAKERGLQCPFKWEEQHE